MTTTILRAPWTPGPDLPRESGTGPVWISLTEFTADHHVRALGVAVNGLRLRRRWPATTGSVGMWLWAEPARRRSGSLSVWSGSRPLLDFVRRPDHVRIVRAYRDHGTMRATVWRADRFDAAVVWSTARALLIGTTPWPASAPPVARSEEP
ncbi:hypothetical protein [Streptomyces sp. NPDC049813]|uniref:hypothetical protein n=1 Tax=Streptomyces sp. NPDC049813 TaxID=3365597 RepID=UPI0037900115